MEREGRILPHHELDEKIERLFHRYWDEEMSEEEQYEIENDAEELVRQHGWSDVYCAACDYLRAKCTEPEAVINFAHLYWIYGWHKNPIDDPYEFLGCFYARIDIYCTQGCGHAERRDGVKPWQSTVPMKMIPGKANPFSCTDPEAGNCRCV